MKHPKVRKTLDIGLNDDDPLVNPEFALFSVIDESALDMLLYLEHFKVPLTITDPFDYVRILKEKGYFEDTVLNYFEGVRRQFDRLPIII